MELDDFKKVWKKEDRPTITRESLQQRIDQVQKSGKKIRRAFVMEVVIIAVILLFFVGVIIIFDEAMQAFMYKLAVITFLGFLPTAYRLFQSQLWINKMDYGTDIRSNLIAFLTYYRTTLKWYRWSSFIVSILLFIMLFTDKDFLALGIEWQIGTCAYVLLILILTRPYLKKMYGRHVQELESFL